jgi:tetratricopeptide (TPR) repeat protein
MMKTMTTLREYLQYTEDALSAGRVEDALEHCQHVLSHFPESLEAHRLLGEIYLAQNRLVEAQQTFDWVLTNDPENVITYCNRALISERMGDLDTALDCYQQAYELSRGNSQIRQEFNKLSARLGQPGFMFSRAGLARLYMRGDLLFHATQEWEAVLSATPDRLDARTGLLETCWRDGNYEQAEQIALKLLEEVPGCLKALLLLAHITYAQNPSRARDLLQRAEALDPEMVMARELFGDLLASQPGDPFLALLQKEPAPVPPPREAATQRPPITASSPSEHPAFSQQAEVASVAGATDLENEPIFGWTTPDPYPQSTAPTPALSADATAIAPLTEQSTMDDHSGSWPVFRPSAEESGPSWQAQLGFEAASESTEMEQQAPTPPAWLDTLNAAPRRQTSGPLTPEAAGLPSALPSAPASSVVPPAEPAQPSQPQPSPLAAAPEAVPAAARREADDVEPFPFLGEDADPEMGWPEWLKSLGAEAMEAGESPVSPTSSTSSTSPTEQADTVEPPARDPAVWESAAPSFGLSARSESEPDPWISQAQGPATWEVPPVETLEPPEGSSSDEDAYLAASTWGGLGEQSDTATKPAWLEQLQTSHTPLQEPQEPSSPSWLPGLEGMPQPPATPSTSWDLQSESPAATSAPWLEHLNTAPPSTPLPPLASQPPQETPSWLDQLATPREEQEERLLTTLEDLEQKLYAQGFVPLQPGELSSIAQQAPEPQRAPEPEETVRAPLHQADHNLRQQMVPPAPEPEPLWPATPTPEPSRTGPSHPPTLPGYRPDALLEDELETTMKRPVFRLQPVQQRPPASAEPPATRRTREPAAVSPNQRQEGELSYKEHLIRGYQYQLAGAYDEAMQEYRLVIRNQPDLLGEVISNTRALLKLAPKYAAGYRVLGDAYMRQGEYLQAMEAYNKALTMTRRAKGQGASS